MQVKSCQVQRSRRVDKREGNKVGSRGEVSGVAIGENAERKTLTKEDFHRSQDNNKAGLESEEIERRSRAKYGRRSSMQIKQKGFVKMGEIRNVSKNTLQREGR